MEYRYLVSPGMKVAKIFKPATPVITERICRRVSQLSALLYASVRFMEAVDVMALQIRPASLGEIVFSTAATMSLDLLVYLCLVDSLQLLKSNHFL